MRQSTPLNAILKLEHLKATGRKKIEWATTNGKAAPQRSVRQKTTRFKAITLLFQQITKDELITERKGTIFLQIVY